GIGDRVEGVAPEPADFPGAKVQVVLGRAQDPHADAGELFGDGGDAGPAPVVVEHDVRPAAAQRVDHAVVLVLQLGGEVDEIGELGVVFLVGPALFPQCGPDAV